MNEWLNKTDIQSASAISPSSLTPHMHNSNEYDGAAGYYTPAKNLNTLAQAANFCDSSLQPRGSAKKRWLRQAISEDQCDSPNSRPGNFLFLNILLLLSVFMIFCSSTKIF